MHSGCRDKTLAIRVRCRYMYTAVLEEVTEKLRIKYRNAYLVAIHSLVREYDNKTIEDDRASVRSANPFA